MKYLFILSVLIYFWQSATLAKNGRIIGGQTAIAGQFPHAAAITVQTKDSRFFCGGTLIDREWVITAGQCVDGAVLFTIQLGSNSLYDTDSNRVIVATSEFVLHPKFDPMTLENDIALIKLRMPVEFSAYLNKVNVLGAHHVVASTLLVALGWGQMNDNNSSLSNDLRWVDVVAISNDECRLTYGNQITNITLCVEGNFNEGSCYGDTGSGLIHVVSGYHILLGIASFVSGNGCESTDPSGYIRTSDYRDWIRNTTNV